MTGMSKPKEDIIEVLTKDRYRDLKFVRRSNKYLRLFLTYFDLKREVREIGKNSKDKLIIQYPLYSKIATRYLFNILRNRDVQLVGFVHDIEALRMNKNNKKKVTDELGILNKFDVLIVHNQYMKKWLIDQGITCEFVELNIFDYLNDKPIVNANIDKPIVYAGNLEKASFFKKLNIRKKIILFGVNKEEKYPQNVTYCGAKKPDELPLYLDGSFGLVWDGDRVDTNSGMYGEYTRYNNPHKVSLYLSSGLPVIVWKQAAIAQFVESNHVGIAIDSLQDIDDILSNMNPDDYLVMINNVQKMSNRLRTGYYTKHAVNSIID
ncbi:sugar transferase [Latilactobacillus curvatus]|uniref:sugar transferase n=1 Tax=Latilactobacillus curvatus TaxID=28038 RepID=UPI000FECD48F|nr:sugar transferase [Latilactobacillus curvatus]QAR35030.1 hypothetical protein EQK21_02780 [Latilactobacillus curvatus]